ncbi:hypothetical protein [Glycomyces paridis]|uniref:Uncharacterized protein n=1 Tax=Glycomyces paridis TaxID=2126555 RepID=A0A4S8PCH0_9ACTN|nr:hypothetical protein [Glycomyces paridis]THV27215.1 hypothetical protein E9998_15230 [Glycomyces paridis]
MNTKRHPSIDEPGSLADLVLCIAFLFAMLSIFTDLLADRLGPASIALAVIGAALKIARPRRADRPRPSPDGDV